MDLLPESPPVDQSARSWRTFAIVSVLALVVGALALTTSAAGDEGRQASATVTPPRPVASEGAPVEAADGLTGFGATRSVWDGHHEPLPHLGEGSYGPLIGDGRPKYSAVIGDERVLSYYFELAESVSLQEAMHQVLAEFPAGATYGHEDTEESRCLLVEVRSPEVESVLDDYRPVVGFFTTGRDLQRNEVTHAVLTVAGPDETTDLGFC